MHSRQTKSHTPNTAPTKTVESPQKAAVSATSVTRIPAWANGRNIQLLASLTSQNTSAVPDIQSRIAIGQSSDPYEQEADSIAEQIMRMPDPSEQLQRKCACNGSTGSSEDECEEYRAKRAVHPQLQRRATIPGNPTGTAIPNTTTFAPAIVQQALRNNGHRLDTNTRAFMESRFGADFSHVLIHTDTQAAESAQAVNALAYTVGRDVVFARGQYAPGTSAGKRLLAHELAHTIQQSSNSLILQRSTAGTAATNPIQSPGSTVTSTPIPARGPNPASCLSPLCDAIPQNSSHVQQYADKWSADALSCMKKLAPASNASHANEILSNFEQELQGEMAELNQWYNGLPSAQRTSQSREYLARLKSICRRKQREAAIEFRFNVIFERGPGQPKWGERPGEWDEIETALEALPDEATWANPILLHFRREACHPNDVDPATGQCWGRGGGLTGGETDVGTGVIRVFSAGLGPQPYSRSARLGFSATAQTLRHEVGHVIESQIPQAELSNFFENIMHWHQYPWAWISVNPPPYPNWKKERDLLRAELGLDDAKLDAWLRGLVAGTPVVQGSKTYIKQPVTPGSGSFFLLSYETAQMPAGREFEYARTGQDDYFAELYALAVSRPEFLHAALPPAQIAWLKRVVFHTPEHLERIVREAAIAGPALDEFLIRASQKFTLQQLQNVLGTLGTGPRTPTAQGIQTKLASSQPTNPYESEIQQT